MVETEGLEPPPPPRVENRCNPRNPEAAGDSEDHVANLLHTKCELLRLCGIG